MSSIQDLLKDVSGNAIISIDTVTPVALKGGASNPMKGKVHKVMIGGNVMVFTNKTINGYEAMVERRLAKEGKDPASFQLGQRQWGKRIEGTPFVEHNGEMYLEVIFLKPGKSYYELNAQQINPEFIEGLPEKKAEGEQGGLDNKVVIRTFKVSNIAGITINGEHHVL